MKKQKRSGRRSSRLGLGKGKPVSNGLELVCRSGYAARGFVYFSIGLIALLVALGRKQRAEGATGALEVWADAPLGIPLLWLTGLGLFGFAVWRALQSILDADNQGDKPKAIAARLGQAVSGIVYAALGYSVIQLGRALGDLGGTSDTGANGGVSKMLAMEGGEWLVMLAGLFVAGCGVGNLIQAFKRDFTKPLRCPASFRTRVQKLGQIGYAARGIVFLPAGVFLFLAGQHANAQEAKDTGQALEWLGALPFGDALLSGAALGLAAFGLFAFIEARYRRLNLDGVLPA